MRVCGPTHHLQTYPLSVSVCVHRVSQAHPYNFLNVAHSYSRTHSILTLELYIYIYIYALSHILSLSLSYSHILSLPLLLSHTLSLPLLLYSTLTHTQHEQTAILITLTIQISTEILTAVTTLIASQPTLKTVTIITILIFLTPNNPNDPNNLNNHNNPYNPHNPNKPNNSNNPNNQPHLRPASLGEAPQTRVNRIIRDIGL
jgi:hypothetical protein